MTTVIPNGYSLATLTFGVTGGTRVYQTTLGVLPQISLTAAQQNAALRSGMTSTGFAANAANIFVGFSLNETKILYRNLGGILISDIDTTPVIGTKTGSALPVNTSVIVRKVTSFAGKKYRGRLLYPPVFWDESAVNSTGNNVGGTFASYQTIWNNTYTALVGAGLQPVLLHSDSTPPTTINSFSLVNRIGTIGKRLRP